MDIKLTNPNGIKLKTAGKYCSQDVNVLPQLEAITITPSKSEGVFIPSSGKAAFSQVTVEAIPSAYIVPTGSKDITTNGTHDVAAFASVVVKVPSEKPSLFAVSISLDGSIITITPTIRNGSFVTGYKVYADMELIGETATVSYDLSQSLTAAGTYVVAVKAMGTNFDDSVFSNAVSYTVEPPKVLTTPSISLVSGTTIQIDAIDDAAQTIEVYAGNTKIGEVSKQ